MSRRRRRLPLRIKFAAVLSLVLGISAVLMASTLVGLYSYRRTIKELGTRIEELPLAAELLESIVYLVHPELGPERDAETGKVVPRAFARRLQRVERALAAYRDRLRKLARHEGMLRRVEEQDALDEIELALKELHEASEQEAGVRGGVRLLPPEVAGRGERRRDPEPGLKEPLARTLRSIGPLLRGAFADVDRMVDESRELYRNTLRVAWISGALVLVTLLGFARLFYRWVFRPIRVLHRSVNRVREGDLEHRVDLQTGDEMEDLARSFNAMTERLQQICTDLERQVEERSRQLVRTERLASVGFLAAGVAHEINNPLASISLGAEALTRRLRQLLDPEGENRYQDIWRCLEMIQSEAFRCKGITEKLLDFSRAGELKRTPASLPALVADVIDIVQHLGRYREKRIVLDAPQDVVAEVNPEEIKQVALNLIVNALDSMDAGGTLRIEVRQDERWAVLVFEDDGCGMTKEVLENVFEPFFTARRSRRGTGLGLSITHRIVVQHDGEITAHSDGPGQGSRFTVRLPLTAKGMPTGDEQEVDGGKRAA